MAKKRKKHFFKDQEVFQLCIIPVLEGKIDATTGKPLSFNEKIENRQSSTTTTNNTPA